MLSAGLVAAGCAEAPGSVAVPSAAGAATSVLQAPTLSPGQDVPAPAGQPALTLIGRIGQTNDRAALSFDVDTLERIGTVAVTVHDPWVRHDLQLEGIWLADLLRVARIDPAATSMHLTALDDYQIDLPVADVPAGRVLLATRTASGTPIPIDEGGPTRIVFVEDGRGAASPALWIWSISTIEVK